MKLLISQKHNLMKNRLVAPIILLLFFSLFLVNCNKDKETKFVIEVDSIHIADTIKLSETLRIEFFGTIGNNGCYDFSHDETNLEGSTISIKLWGKNSGSDDCPAVIVKLDGTYYDINFNAAGSYIVEIIQPDNSKITNTVVVEDP